MGAADMVKPAVKQRVEVKRKRRVRVMGPLGDLGCWLLWLWLRFWLCDEELEARGCCAEGGMGAVEEDGDVVDDCDGDTMNYVLAKLHVLVFFSLRNGTSK
jgi:hypothetical protein